MEDRGNVTPAKKNRNGSGLGEPADARPTLQSARYALDAAHELVPRDARMAAEKAYLAATQAADVAAVAQGHQPPEGTGGRLQALTRLDRSTKRRTQTVQHFGTVHTLLHGECFHEGRCDAKTLDEGMRAAAALVSQVEKFVGFDGNPRPRKA